MPATVSIWDGVTGDWGAAADWSPSGVPDSASAQASINSGTVTIASSASYALDTLSLDGAGALLNVLGTLSVAGSVDIESGTVSLGQDGTISGAPDVTIGSSGILDISAAAPGANQALVFDSLSDGGQILLGNNTLAIGAAGGDSHLSGTISAAAGGSVLQAGTGSATLDSVTMGNGAFYVMDGSILENTGSSNLFYLAIGEGTSGAASGILSGGTLTIGNTDPNSGAALQIGDWGGTGTFTQTGGLLSLVGSLNIGNQGGSGSYDISGGTLALDGGMYVLGRNTVSTASSGLLSISGTGIVDVAAGSLILGDNVSSTGAEGTGTIVQTGGTLEIGAGGALYLAAYGNGRYDLDGGILQVGGANLHGVYNAHGGTYAFNLGGGTIDVTGSALTTSVNATLSNATTSTIDLEGLGAAFTGSITGSGSLAITGSGTASFTSLVTTGGLTLNGNTLDLSAGSTDQIGALNGSGTIILGNTALAIGAGDADSTFSGLIETGTAKQGGLIDKIGAGSLTLDNVVMNAGTNNSGLYIADGSLVENSGSSSLFYLAVGEGTGSTASASLSGGSLTIGGTGSALQIGDWGGTGTFTQTGGTLTVATGSLNIGNQGGSGNYSISAGTLAFDGGIFDIGRSKGTISGSSGTLSISGTGLVDVASGQIVLGSQYSPTGANSSGTIIQSGGELRIENGITFYLSGQSGTEGLYDLSGGTLSIGGASLNGGGGTYAFNLGGGTIDVIGSALTTSVNATLTHGTTSTIDLEGLGANFSGSITGSGNLDITGAGTAGFNDLLTTGGIDLAGNATLAVLDSGSVGELMVGASHSATVSVHAGDTLSLSGATALSIGNAGTLALTGGSIATAGSIVNAGSLTLDNTALTDSGTLTNNGAITLDPSSLTVAALDGTGSITIESGSTLDVEGSVSAGETIIFSGSSDLLQLGASSDIILGTIVNFGTADTIDFTGLSYDSQATATLSGDVLTVVDGTTTLHLNLTSSTGYAGLYFHLAQDGAGTSLIVNDDPTCYCAGTRILTDRGEVSIEDLRIGDLVVTTEHGLQMIRWIGQSTIATCFADPMRVAPVRIRESAFGPGVPARDLRVSPCHAVFLEGVLVQANALVNGTSIVQETALPERFTYYHIELENHALLLAEGLPAESFVDNVSRLTFDNWAEYQTLGLNQSIEEMPHPRVQSHRQVPYGLRQVLAAKQREWMALNAQSLLETG